MPTEAKPEIYITIHKGWRNRLFKMSVKAGKQDYSDQASLDTLSSSYMVVASPYMAGQNGKIDASSACNR